VSKALRNASAFAACASDPQGMLRVDFPQLEHNPFVAGGLVLMLAGAVLYYLKRIPGTLYNFVERFFIVKMEILDEDEAYRSLDADLAGG
jgi:hypothetical protein